MKIVGIMMVRNEQNHVERVFKNSIDFCDELIVADNYSTDNTYTILQELAETDERVRLVQIKDHGNSHYLLEEYANTPTWIFAVDGDEIYDPEGLRRFRQRILDGEFSDIWSIQSNVLHCNYLDEAARVARGYLTPPARSITKLFNFSHIESWTGKTERLHDGNLVFRQDGSRQGLKIYNTTLWEDADFRCLHTCFLPRSGQEGTNRINPLEMRTKRRKGLACFLAKALGFMGIKAEDARSSEYKLEKYARGEIVEKDVSAFIN